MYLLIYAKDAALTAGEGIISFMFKPISERAPIFWVKC
jgi:hypothetical protein